jgi:AcrR family transcriptional regulator
MPTVRTKAGRTRDLRPAMRIVALEGLFASASDYFSVPYVSLFALSLGASRTQIGLIAAVIALLGSVMQLPMAVLTEGRWSRKQWFILSGVLARGLWIPIALLPFYASGQRAVWLFVLLVAVDVIAKGGFYETTIQEIADTAEVSVGTIYNYFRSKEEILGYIFEVECHHRAQLLQTLLAQNRPINQRFETFLRLHFAELRQNPSLKKLMIQEYRFPLKHEFAPMEEYASQIPGLIGELLRPDGDSGLIGTIAFGALQALSMRFLLSRDIDVEAAVQLMCTLFVSQRLPSHRIE